MHIWAALTGLSGLDKGRRGGRRRRQEQEKEKEEKNRKRKQKGPCCREWRGVEEGNGE